MKIKMLFAPFVLLWAGSALADGDFPSYLNEKYCNDIKLDFITTSIKSLQSYRDQQLASQHRGGMNNIRKYLDQREEWLKECDQYLSQTKNGRVFQDEATTKSIFNAMDAVSTELNSLISGITYSVDSGGTPTDVAAEKFDHLFKLVDDHQTMMLLKGQVVYR